MTKIYHYTLDRDFEQIDLAGYLHVLSEGEQNKIRGFRNKQDACLSLFGRLLLLHSFRDFTIPLKDLKTLQLTGHKKPYLGSMPGLSFSISHSDRIVVLAVSNDGTVGIDIEKISEIRPDDIRHFLSLLNSRGFSEDCTQEDFYRIWTQSEAALKAHGTGFIVNLDTFKILPGMAVIGESTWFLREVDLVPGFICHIASCRKDLEVDVYAVPDGEIACFNKQF